MGPEQSGPYWIHQGWASLVYAHVCDHKTTQRLGILLRASDPDAAVACMGRWWQWDGPCELNYDVTAWWPMDLLPPDLADARARYWEEFCPVFHQDRLVGVLFRRAAVAAQGCEPRTAQVAGRD